MKSTAFFCVALVLGGAAAAGTEASSVGSVAGNSQDQSAAEGTASSD